jgi:HTH-type transcriptional regulator/antitoxin HigA
MPMIKNEKQYKVAKAKLERWLKTQGQLRHKASQPDWLHSEQAFGVKQEISQLRREIKEYEDILSGKAKLPDPSLVTEIPHLLISWRIARHWTQRQLAERLGMHENQIQKYESEDYGCASLETITRIAAALKEGGPSLRRARPSGS